MRNEAFVFGLPVGSTALLARPSSVSVRNVQKSAVPVCRRLSLNRRLTPTAINRAPTGDEMGDDDDSASIGNPGDHSESLGVPLPAMTPKERAWFNDAPTGKARMERLLEIARQRHGEALTAKLETARANDTPLSSNVADDYMESLSAGKVEKFQSEVPMKRAVDLTQSEPPLEDLQAKIRREMDEAVSDSEREERMSRSPPVTPPQDAIDDTMADLQHELAEMKAEAARKAATRQPPVQPPVQPSVAASSRSAGENVDPSTVDKQLTFLEQHLEKLKREAAEEAGEVVENVSGSGPPDPEVVKSRVRDIAEQFGNGGKRDVIPGSLGDGLGQLSEEETLAAFEEIRAAQSTEAGAAPGDLIPVSLPSRSEVDRDDSVAAGDIAEGARLALIALRIESSRFVTEQRKALHEHEQKIADIFERYVPDLS